MPINENAPLELAKFKKGNKYDTGFFSGWTDLTKEQRRRLNKLAEDTTGEEAREDERIQREIDAMSARGLADPTIYG